MTRDEFLEFAIVGDMVEVIGRSGYRGKKATIVGFASNGESAKVHFDSGKEIFISHRFLNLLKLGRKIGKTMKVWTNTTFLGHYPTATAAVVVAETSKRAAELLNEKLESIKLKGDIKPEDMFSINMDVESCTIFADGDY